MMSDCSSLLEPKPRSVIRVVGSNFVLAVVYFLLARLGLLLASLHGNVSPIWPASGLAVAAIWLGGIRLLPGVFVGAFVANFLTDVSPLVALFVAVGNTSEAWLGSRLLHLVSRLRARLAEYAEAVGFVAASLIAPAASATVGVFALIAGRTVGADAVGGLWWTWWGGDALGILLIAPLVRSFVSPGGERGPELAGGWWRGALLCVAVVAAAWLITSVRFAAPILFGFLPLLVLAGMWFGVRGCRVSMVGIGGICVWAVVHGAGPFGGAALNERLLLLGLFLGSAGVAALIVPEIVKVPDARLALWVLVMGWGLNGMVLLAIESQRHRLDEHRFESLRDEAEHSIQRRARSCGDLVRIGAAFVESIPDVSPVQWRRFVESVELGGAHPEVTGLGLVRPVAREDVEAFSRKQWDDGLPGFEVHPVSGMGEDVDVHYLITRVEPLVDNRDALGLDLATEAVRRGVLAASREAGSTRMSGRLVLAQDAKSRPGFLLVHPLTVRPGASSGSGAGAGWVYAAFVAEKFFGPAGEQRSGSVGLAVYSGSARDPEQLLYSSAGAQDPVVTTRMELFGQPCLIEWSRGPGFIGSEGVSSAAVASSLCMVALLFSVLVSTLQSTGRRAEQLAAAATRELSEAKNRIDSLLERADCILWDAEVAIDGDDWNWSFNVHPSGLYQRLFGKRMPTLEQGLWYQLNIPEMHEMDQRSRAAFLNYANGYEQEFRVVEENRTVWLREKVAIKVLAPGRWKVAAVVTEVTSRRAAELALQATNRDLHNEIAERKRAEEEAQEARRSAEDANRAKSEFLATMSHEIRTPMNSIIGFTDLLLESKLHDEQREWVSIIRESGRSLLSIINDILDLSKIEAGKVELERISFAPVMIARDIAGLMVAGARKKGVRLEIEAGPQVPSHVIGDPVRFRQILLNLVSNALKFTPSGEVRIRFRWLIVESPVSEGVLEVDVSDTGIGIAPDKVDRLFKRFAQADGSTTREFGGTGLGLSIVRSLVELMGGDIGVRSEPGMGSTFWFRVPFAVGRNETAPQGAPEKAAQSEGQLVRGDIRVLVADDVEFNLRLASLMLNKLGCRVDVASNGEAAIEKVDTEHYQIVFMDCQMPTLDGFEATRRIRQREAGERRVPIVAMTANAVVGDRERCIAAGMDDYVAKPLELDELKRVVLRWGQRSQ